jgi:hypothetical protein
MQPALLWNGDLLRPMPGSSFIAFILSNQCGQVLAVGLMEIENLIRYTERAVGLKPSASQGEARLRGL